jgi:simple sugar transport system permease protein
LAPTSNYGILIAIVLVVAVYLILDKTILGYELKAVGYNKNASEYGGISVNRAVLTAMAISGGLAGMGGAVHLMGMGERISLFAGQEGFGFEGISVALIGASNPFGVLLSGLFYGALKYGGSKLNLIQAPSEIV